MKSERAQFQEIGIQELMIENLKKRKISNKYLDDYLSLQFEVLNLNISPKT